MPVALPQLKITDSLRTAITEHRSQNVEVVGPWGSGKSIVALQVAVAVRRPLCIISAGRIEAEAVYDDLVTFAGAESTLFFPAWEVLPTDAMAPADDVVAERMNTLQALTNALANGEVRNIVVPVRALLQRVIAPRRLTKDTVFLEVGKEYNLEELLARLVHLGYERELMVEQRGQMSLRGGIFDIFPISSELPYRIEFFGDEIESIRRFEPETQRSIDRQRQVTILPRSEKLMLSELANQREALGSVLDYLPNDTLIALDEPLAVAEEAERISLQFADVPHFQPWESARDGLGEFTGISLAQVSFARPGGGTRLTAPMGSILGWERRLEGFWEQLQQWDRDGYTVVILCVNTGERQRLLELLEAQGYRPGQDRFDLRVEIGRLRAGFVSTADRVAVLSEREMFGRRYVRRTRRRFEAGASITVFSDLRPGDYVVHVHHGIGRYLGLRRFPGKAGDFLTIQYTAGDKLYLPVTHIDAIQKYVGGDDARPKVDRLGGATWARTKARVKKAIRDMAEELIKLYATRESRPGHSFSVDTPWQLEFEEAFEYDETPDQARAIVEVKRDMESPKPMDRLLCGDVGYGKTEVALRAAFKAVQDGKQVAVLVPTTVLAEQHYTTFSERLADYPVRIEMLSRFRSAKLQRETIERLKSGEVDIVIGTHRLISKDVHFKDLGLIVVDEEQRFGVRHKERLRQLRALADVLTMTATPIPRTLNMSLTGIRDMSLINTAPNDRLPIHTCIESFDERLIAEAIERELARQGQVFFVHNRVQTILHYAELVRRLAPGARVAVAHGQMPEHELEQVMTAFIHKEVDVLVCTTIIGSGLDIPNANTIVIHNADHFGLAELYQLRGRVGRYKHRAFAYLLVPGERALSEDAQKRLKALEEFSTLGAGFRIAMRDLEIRGCGDILGSRQHGHIIAVGYDTYTHLLNEAVAELKGESYAPRSLPPVEIAIDAYIPEEYVPSEAQKITLYKRISGARSVEELEELRAELADRFGAPPAPVQRLVNVMRVRVLGVEAGANRIVAARAMLKVEFKSGAQLSRKIRNTVSLEFGNRAEFSWQDTPAITLSLNTETPEDTLRMAEQLLKTVGGTEATFQEASL